VAVKKENRLIVGNISWADTIPKWLLEEVKAERLIFGLAGIMNPDAEKVGDAEVCVYLYTLGLAHPLCHRLAQVYIYLSAKLMKRRGRKLEAFMGEKLKQGLTSDEEYELKQLKGMIYSKRGGDINNPLFEAMKHLKKECEKLPDRSNTLYGWLRR